jgi:hypothetical protein
MRLGNIWFKGSRWVDNGIRNAGDGVPEEGWILMTHLEFITTGQFL